MSSEKALTELRGFLDAYTLKDHVSSSGLEPDLKKSFKKIYPVLVFSKAIEKAGPWKEKKRSAQFIQYLKETISDILQCILMGVQGLYKPSYLSLRSGVENFVKCLGLAEAQNVLSLTSVYELLDVVRDTAFVSSDVEGRKAYQALRGEYATLCGYVHTATSAHMSLDTVVGAFPRYVAADGKLLFEQISRISVDIIKLLVLLFPKLFQQLHHKQFDIICDALPKTFKRHVNA